MVEMGLFLYINKSFTKYLYEKIKSFKIIEEKTTFSSIVLSLYPIVEPSVWNDFQICLMKGKGNNFPGYRHMPYEIFFSFFYFVIKLYKVLSV